jgi:AmmeMemoRadiSam system protein B
MVRQPVVAGRFYNATWDTLTRQIEQCFLGHLGPGKLPVGEPIRESQIVGLVSPHAGYMCSGFAAAHGFARLAEGPRPDAVVVLGVSHTGFGAPVAVDDSDAWHTPLGDIPVDRELGDAIVRTGAAQADAGAHRGEHSIEVQLPFIQYIWSGMPFVPIVLGLAPASAKTKDKVAELGRAIAGASSGRRLVVIASTDLTHYERQDAAERKDARAIKPILELDADGLLSVVVGEGITMCGVVPTAAMLQAAKAMGASAGELLKYHTSGDAIGDKSQVVGYASIAIT